MTRALIIGAGIAGTAAAMALQRVGVDAEIYEARPDRADSIGAFLTLGSNGIAALRCIDADGLAGAAGFATPGIQVRSGTGRHLGVATITTTLPEGPVSHTLKRSDLYRALYDEATRRGIQPRIDPRAPAPRYAGLVNVGGYASRVPVDEGRGEYSMIFGSRAFFGYVVAPDGQVWWFANVPRRDEPGRGEVESTTDEEWRDCLTSLFADDTGPAVALIRASADIVQASPVHTIAHLPTWHSRRMIVIGDAAHAPSPSSGQGASLSIEDAVELARCLRDIPDREAAFARFEALRRPRVQRIIKQAARVNSSKADRGLRRVVRDAMLPTVLKLATKQQAKPYDHRIDWSLPAAAATAHAGAQR